MRIDIVSIFPDYLEPLQLSLVGKATRTGLVELGVHDLRQWTHDVHRAVDDAPYGGGPGMVMKPQIWGPALDGVCRPETRLVVPTPAGRPFTQELAHAYAAEKHLVFACGRYEGIDQRVVDDAARRMPVDEVSIGDYVLVGGEAAVLVIVEAVVRLLPGVLGNARSAAEDSFSDGLLEGPSYTRPEVWRDLAVPDVLRSGNHALIDRWRRDQALERTARRRPDLLAALPEGSLDKHDRGVLEGLDPEQA
jgi:tRNA (guanine37-N1)-methyltransferase